MGTELQFRKGEKSGMDDVECDCTPAPLICSMAKWLKL